MEAGFSKISILFVIDRFQYFIELSCEVVRRRPCLFESHLFQGNLVSGLRNALIPAPLLCASNLFPPLRGGVVGELDEGAEEQGDGTAEVDHGGHGKSASILYLRHCACILWGCLQKNCVDHNPNEKIEAVEEVGKAELWPGYLGAGHELVLWKILFLQLRIIY